MVDAGDLPFGKRRAPFPRRRRRKRTLSQNFRAQRFARVLLQRPDRARNNRSFRCDGRSPFRKGALGGGRRRRRSGVFYDRLLRDARSFAPFRRAFRARALARFARPPRRDATRRNRPDVPRFRTSNADAFARRAGKNGKNARFGVLGPERFDKIPSKRALPPCQRRVSASK